MRTTFSILSWNVALLERSDEAPFNWSIEQSEAAIRQTVLDLDPDIVLFQELPKLVPYIETHEMVRANPESHSGHLATLIRRELTEGRGPRVATVPRCAVLTTLSGITIANVHFTSGTGESAAAERLEQVRMVQRASPTDSLVIIGDTNTRVEEVRQITELGLSTEPPPWPTWDSRRNHFRADGPKFTSYFTRWFVAGGVEVDTTEVWTDPHETEEHRFHLSDHYPMTIEIGF